MPAGSFGFISRLSIVPAEYRFGRGPVEQSVDRSRLDRARVDLSGARERRRRPIDLLGPVTERGTDPRHEDAVADELLMEERAVRRRRRAVVVEALEDRARGEVAADR